MSVCSPWLREFSQLEVFHWMVEWATRPYYSASRCCFMKGASWKLYLSMPWPVQVDNFGERLYYWHGNLLFSTAISHDSIPGNWGIAKRRYLERCVDLYG